MKKLLLAISLLLLFVGFSGAAQQLLINGETGLQSRTKINANDTELYNGIVRDSVQMNPTTAPTHSEALFYYDSTTKTFNVYNDEPDVTLNVGEEMFIRVYNNSGGDIDNGEVCYLSGVFNGFPTIDLAQANAAGTSLATIGLATHSIEDGTYGYITNSGLVRDVGTSGFLAGDRLYLSATVAGGIVKIPPTSPNYLVGLGQAVVIDGAVGSILTNINVGTNTAGVIRIFNGAVLEDTALAVTSSGSVVTLTYQQEGGGDLSLFFNGAFTNFDSTDPVASITLTAGSDTAPTLNYVYIPESTGVLTVSTSNFPTAQHVPVATALVQSAGGVQTDGVYKLHAWTDHLADSDDQGHLAHVNHWIRNQNATWVSGVVPTTSITTNGGAIDNVYFSNTSGVILQLHDHAYPAFDMSGSDPMFCINDDTTAYRRVTDLSTLDEDSTGASLRSNNTYYSIVVWGVVSESSGDSQLFCNLPSGFYITETTAINDSSNYTNFQIPSEFTGTGFLIARIVLRYQTADSGTFTEVLTEDLRGLQPSTAAGGGGVSGGTTFSDNLFQIFNVADNTKIVDFDVSALTTSTIRTIIMPDSDVDLGNVSATTINDIGDASAAGAVDFVTYLQQWDVGSGGFQIGDGGSNYVQFSTTGITFGGTYNMSANLVSDYITMTPAATEPSTTDGLFRNVSGVSGYPDVFSIYDGSDIWRLIGVDSDDTVGAGYMITHDGSNWQSSLIQSELKVNTIGNFTTPITTNPYTLTAANCYNSALHYGATGEIDLPAGVDGMAILIYNTGAFTITIDPNGSEVIVRDGSAQTGGVSFTLSSGAGNYVCIIFNGTQWVTMGYKGTLAVGS
jgi:hypothetical protein